MTFLAVFANSTKRSNGIPIGSGRTLTCEDENLKFVVIGLKKPLNFELYRKKF
jgi:hypothetical protein